MTFVTKLFIAVLLASLGTAVTKVRASDVSATSETTNTPARLVMIAEHEEGAETREFIEAVEGQLSDLQVTFAVEWVEKISTDLPEQIEAAGQLAARTDAVAVFWCDLNRQDQLYLYLSDGGHGRVLVRKLAIRDEAGDPFETLAIIVRAAVDALLSGGEIGVAVELPPPTPAPIEIEKKILEPPPPKDRLQETHKPTPAPRAAHIGLAVAYSLSGYSSKRRVVNGLDLGFSVIFAKGWIIFADYVFRGPIKADATVVDASGDEGTVAIDIQSHPITIGLGYGGEIDRFRLGGALALTGDFVSQDTRAVAGGDVMKPNNPVVFSVAPLLDAAFSPRSHIAIYVMAGVDILLNNIRYVAEDTSIADDGYAVLEKPWWVRPRLSAGLRFII